MNTQSFTFGKNWKIFIDHYLSAERVEEARKSFSEFAGKDCLEGKTFIDVGCGSGLFSLAACRLGAAKVVSLDVDPDCVKCCELLRKMEGNPTYWEILHGSILEENFVSSLGVYDFVYSWGVLHHTGNIWKAIENTSILVKEKGFLYLAIYNKTDGFLHGDGRMGTSHFWAKEKKVYAAMPPFVQRLADYSVMSLVFFAYVLTFRNPVKKMHDHKKLRGMSWRVDVSDWMGGYPYEPTTVAEVFVFLKKLGFSLENLNCNNGLMNNHYLFLKM